MTIDEAKELKGLDALIAALQIFRQYGNSPYTHCEHDIMIMCGIAPEEVSQEDKDVLKELGFDEYGEGFGSYLFGC